MLPHPEIVFKNIIFSNLKYFVKWMHQIHLTYPSLDI